MRTTATCPVCQQVFTRVHTKGATPICCSRACANTARVVTAETRTKMSRARSGDANARYKGEWVLTDRRTGHVRTWVWISPEERDAFGLRKSYMLRSRYVWNKTHPEDLVGPRDHIHHRDHDTLNDAPENLQKMTPTEHAEHHFRRPRGPLSEEHKATLSRLMKKYPDRNCEACGVPLSRKQISGKHRFCSRACGYRFRTGKGRTGW